MATAQQLTMSLGRMDDLSRQDSFIHKLDPRTKLVTTFAFIICVVSFGKYEISAMVPFILFPIAIISFGNVPIRDILVRIAVVSPFAIFLGMFNPLLDREPMLQTSHLVLSGGWISFFSILLRFILTVSAAILLIATTGFDSVCAAMQKLKVPRIFTIQLMFLYRYLFVLADEAARLIRARSLRSFGKRGTDIKTFGSLTGNLLLRTVDRAESISQAMACRGFQGNIPSMRILNFSVVDIAFAAVCIGAFIVFRFVNLSEVLGNLSLR